MRKHALFFIFIASAFVSRAQNIGINNPTPAASALLDLTSTNKGLLVPRVALTASNSNAPIGGAIVTSLLVYNTATAGASPNNVTPGFYFWDGAKWVRLLGGTTGGEAWQTTGNAGTNSSTNFIGTTDNVPFNFKVNNVKAGTINHIDRNVMLGRLTGNALPIGQDDNVILGDSAGALATSGSNAVIIGSGAASRTTNASNGITIVGSDAGKPNTGAYNTFIGSESGQVHTSGDFNTFLGGFSGMASSTGDQNSFLGYKSGQSNTTGGNNTFVGGFSGGVNTTGSSNTLIGIFSNVSVNNLTNASAIGARARADASNSLVLGSVNGVNGATATVNVGIGVNTPLDRLHVVGNIRMVDGNQAAGKVLTSDANGTASWQTLGAAQANAWGLTGNSGTNPSTNFIGTTDNQKLRFKVNNIHAGLIDHSLASVFLGNNAGVTNTGISNSFFGDNAGTSNNSGNSNTFIGYETGTNNTSGNANSFLGRQAGSSNITGSNNTFIGLDAGRSNISGNSNVAVGKEALFFSSATSNIVAIGDSALRNGTGVKNTAVGSKAGAESTIGDENSFFGFNSGRLNQNGSSNTFIGSEAGKNNSSGLSNSFLGTQAGFSNNGNFNSFVGFLAGKENTSGAFNCFLGASAGEFNTTGNTNTYVGIEAGKFNTTGFSNIAIGKEALRNSANGSNLIAIGDSALINNTTGYNNTALGSKTGAGNSTGFANSFFGYNTGRGSNGNLNTFIGSEAGVTNSSGSGNSFLGSQAGFSNSSGEFNSFTGYEAGLNNSLGDSNTFIGYHAGAINTLGGSNTALGTQANFNSGNLVNATALGANSQVNASNSLVLGSIFGINGATATVNVGIGVNAPLDRLHVVGNIRMVDGNQAANKVMVSDANGTASWQTLGASSVNAWSLTGNSGTVDGTNFVGTTDNVPFNIRVNNQKAGRIDRTNRVVTLGYTAGNSLTSGDNLVMIGDSAGFSNVTGDQNTFVGSRAGRSNISSGNSFFGHNSGLSNITGSSNSFFGEFSGVANSAGTDNSFFGASSGLNNTGGGANVFLGSNSGLGNITGFRNTIIGVNSDVGSSALFNATAIGYQAQVDDNNSLVLGSVAGVNAAATTVKVGIGTTAPSQRLEVVGLNASAATSGSTQNGIVRLAPTGSNATLDIGYNSSPAHAWLQSRDRTNYASNFNLVLNPNGGNIGIGTTNPVVKLDVIGGISIQNSNNLTWGGAFGAGIPTISSSTGDGIYFYPTGSTSGATMKINSSGRVGIGTVTPGGQFELSLDQGRKPSTSTWTIVSDVRLKTIDSNYPKGLKEILALQPLTYHYKNSGERKFEAEVLNASNVGFSAQDVQKIFPEAVGIDSDGYLNFNMHAILVAYVNAFKEQQQQIETLETKLMEFEKRLNAIMGTSATIEAQK